jgi:hypothetical protein
MTLWTLAKYLIGDREAILRVAGCRPALVLGLCLVLVAGFAREYDAEDLLREPWHLLLPLAASLVSSAILYLIVRACAWGHNVKEPPWLAGYLDFLTLYWLTAPLAMVYAIPVERFLSAADATGANLWMLGLVSVWRVLLMARVVSVLYDRSFMTGFFLVMLFGDTLAAIILAMTELPIVAIMGGIRLSDSEMVLHNTVWLLRVLTVLTWPAWLIGAGYVAGRKQSPWEYQLANTEPLPRVAGHMWAAAGLLLVMWAFILPFTQPEQQRRHRVERLLQSGQIREALELMSAYEQSDFPPHWDPPPRLAYRESKPDIGEVYDFVALVNVKPWVRKIFAAKLSNSLYGESDYEWWELNEQELDRRITLIESMPDRNDVVRDHAENLRLISAEQHGHSAPLRERIGKLLEETGERPE